MPFEAKVEADATLKQFDELLKSLADLELKMPNTFVDWQRDDMNRKFPKVEGSGLTYSTTIYPRSRLRRRITNKTGGKSTRRRSTIAAGRPGAHRPILRPELFDQLKERMTEMVKEAVTWQ